jgi:hypothetical protein
MESFSSGFARVDTTTDSKSFVQYLNLIHSLPFFQECKKKSYQELNVCPGTSILEVGCGNGVDAWVMAGLPDVKAGSWYRISITKLFPRNQVNIQVLHLLTL